jgi:hypothetical protein
MYITCKHQYYRRFTLIIDAMVNIKAEYTTTTFKQFLPVNYSGLYRLQNASAKLALQ